MSQISFVLVEPQLGENIGAVARVMSNFGISNLKIVSPRENWPNDKAIAMAAHGAFVLDNAALYDNMLDAISQAHTVVATTATSRNLAKPVVNSKYLVQDVISPAKGEIAFLFGRERTGLTNDELAYATHIVTIPTSSLNKSLNIAQAANIIAYELFSGSNQFQSKSLDLATMESKSMLIEHLLTSLDVKDFFRPSEKKANMVRNIRNMLVKCEFTEQEVRTFRGIIRALSEN